MRLLLAIVVLSFWISCVRAYPANGMIKNNLNRDSIYFPDQAEYLRHSMKCSQNEISWPFYGYIRRCYREGEQGPCNIGRILVFDKKYMKPVCKEMTLQ